MGKKKVNPEEEVNQKPLEEKNLIERHTTPEGKVNIGTAMLELEAKVKQLFEITYQQHNALEWINAWFEQNAKNAIQVDKPKIELL